MYPVHVLAFILFCSICFGNNIPLMSDLVTINFRKIALRYDALGPGTPLVPGKGPCVILSSKERNDLNYPVLVVDLFTDYPIHLAILRGNAINQTSSQVPVSLYVGSKHFNLEFRNETKIRINPSVSARIVKLSLTTYNNLRGIKVCSLDIYTCKPGWDGKICRDKCRDGFFGLGCYRQCDCDLDEPCDHVTGTCPSGCNGSNTGKSEVCNKNRVSSLGMDLFSRTKRPLSHISHGPTKDLQSAQFYLATQQCINVTTQCETKMVFLELALVDTVTIYGVRMRFTWFHFPTPFSMSISVDGKPCYGMSSNTETYLFGEHVLKCQRNNVFGRTVVMRLTTHNKTATLQSGFGVRVCNVDILECSTGFYGRNCRKTCECLGADCDRDTGACPNGICSLNARGRFCNSIDVTASMTLLQKHSESLRPLKWSQAKDLFLHQNTSPHVHNKDHPQYIAWVAFQMSYAYFINMVTVVFDENEPEWMRPRHLAIFTAIETLSDLDFRQQRIWKGISCTSSDQSNQARSNSMDIPCPGLAQTIILVVLSNTPYTHVSSFNVQVWVCADRTFGSECEYDCNCEDDTEVCNKVTGECLSGCASGYKGVNCLQECNLNDVDPTCPTTTCLCKGHDLGDCGPEVPLCSRGCQEGWEGISCDISCPEGYFSHGCRFKCGNCKPDPDGNEVTCFPTNGTCPFGCTDPTMETLTCLNFSIAVGRESPFGGVFIPLQKRAAYENAMEESTLRIIIGLVAVIIACTGIVIVVCCALKCYWDRVTNSKKMEERRVDMIMRRALRAQADGKIQDDHRKYHEEYLKRDAILKMGQNVDSPAEGRMGKLKVKAKAEAIRKMILDMESQRRLKVAGIEPGDEEDEEQDPNQKVALWILNQDFSELIERRKKRLREYTGNPLTITESPYKMSEASVVKDIHKLYDELEELGIP